MTSYINENQFRSCEINNLSNPSAFVRGNPPRPNPRYIIDSSVLKRLAIDDTFHDLSKERAGYDKRAFNDNGPANYLLTGEWFTGDFIKNYKDLINFDEYGKIKAASFESTVTKSIEIRNGLQSSEVNITYDEIIAGFDFPNIAPNLRKKVKESNGSLTLLINTSNPIIKKLDKDSITFSKYLIAISRNNPKTLTDNYLKIANFVRWFLHSSDLNDISRLDTIPRLTLPEPSMKVLSDAGIGFLGDFLSVPGSNTTPFIAVPCFLDSACTSISTLDPGVPIFFETLPSQQIVPIISNYFSCDKYLMCYLLNEGSRFDKDNLYSFSLNILEITDEIKQYVDALRNPDIGLYTEPYNTACGRIKTHIDTYPGLVARYFFGEVEKEKAEQDSDNKKCGTSGAGVPYIGKVLDKLLKLNRPPFRDVNGLWLSPQARDVQTFKTQLNELKNAGPLNSRIPIADARILKIFCNNSGPGGAIFMNMTHEKFLSLFKILADYKRTGDYQQSYTVLKQIFLDGISNANCYTFTSGDELSTLVGRLLGVPSIYQVGNSGSCKLYRCNLYSGSQEDQLRLKIRTGISVINDYIEKINDKLSKTCFFITNYYMQICVLREQLFSKYSGLYGLLFNPDGTLSNPLLIFLFVKYSNAIFILSLMLEACNQFLTIDPANDPVISELYRASEQFTSIKGIDLQSLDETNLTRLQETQLQPLLISIAELENTKNFNVYNTVIEQGFPLSLENIVDDFTPLNQEEDSTLTFRRPSLGLNLKRSDDISKESKSLINFITNEIRRINEPPTRELGRGMEKKLEAQRIANKNFVSEYNNFIDSFKSSILNDGLSDNVEISDFGQFYNKIGYLITTINERIEPLMATSSCDPGRFEHIIVILNEIMRPFGITCPPSQAAGSLNIIQMGGTEQDYNKYCIYYEIQKLLIKTFTKCSSYMTNVANLQETVDPIDIPTILNGISSNYETDDFCHQLLFQQDDDNNYDLENENIGLLIGLKMLAEQYIYSDILNEHEIESRLMSSDEVNPNELLNVSDMLDILRLNYVKLIIVLLGWSNTKYIYTAFDIMESEEIKMEDNPDLIESEETEINDRNIDDYLHSNFPQYGIIRSYLKNSDLNLTLSSFTIMGLSFLNFIYYGTNSSCFYPRLCTSFYPKKLIYEGKRGIIYSNYAPSKLLNSVMINSTDGIFAKLSELVGLSAFETGPALAKGVRQKPAPVKASTNTRKARLKETDEKYIGKSKGGKKTRKNNKY